MAEEGEPQAVVQPEDPEFQLQQHVKFRRRQQILTVNLSKLIGDNLSEFKPTMNGKSHAYTSLKIRNAGLTQLNDTINQYQHLQKIDLSQNLLKDIPNLLQLKYVTKLQLARNLLTNIHFLGREANFPYLKEINLQGNKIGALGPIGTRCLRRINLNNNVIDNLQDFQGHPVLEVLELRGNKIKSLKGLKNMPELQQLYIAQNQLQSLKQLTNLPKLLKLNTRKNKIQTLSQFPKLPSLTYLNLRQNQVSKVADLTGVSETIKNINLLANPIQAQLADNTKKEVWMKFRNFSRINKNQVTAEEREEFDKEYKDRLAEQERERLEKEAAEREAREQQEKEAAEAAS